jgi:KUP system potassium uptake protein
MAEEVKTSPDVAETKPRSIAALILGAVGVVFGDIGTSPLYAVKETFAGPHPLPIDRTHVFGVLSLIFWAVTLVVSVKYVLIVMRADNRGEGGSLVLLSLVDKAAAGRKGLALVGSGLGILAAALFYGDSMITPAISILSAVEGLDVAAPSLDTYVIPLSVVIIIGLFLVQRRGSGAIGGMFGPVMMVWFAVLAVLGLRNIAHAPEVLMAISPHYAVAFFLNNGWLAFLALGSVVLAVTGSEALYADMGHFGRTPIRVAWYVIVFPALMLNYFGQGALLLADPNAIQNPFFLLAPAWALLPLVILATMATIIASQAVISGAFSVTQQATHLGYMPRLRNVHTSEQEKGQIYVPFLNWTLMVMVTVLVIGFGSSSNLAAAYGVAVTGTMLIDSILVSLVMILVWKWRRRAVTIFLSVALIVDGAFFLANATKIPYGGWFPLVVAVAIFVLLTTWKKGRAVLAERLQRDTLSVEDFLQSLSDKVARVPGIAIFLTGSVQGVPLALLHNLKHNKVLHEQNILLTVFVEEIPQVPASRRCEAQDLGNCFRRIVLRYGFMDAIDVPKALANASIAELGFFYEPLTISYFLSRETLVATNSPMAKLSFWRKRLFFWMSRSAASTMEYFQLPTNRVVELGGQVDI